MSRLTPLALALLMFGCGSEEPAPAPEPEEEVAPEPEPLPEPEPEPEPLAECPEDTWAVGSRDDYQPATNGQEASGLARNVARGSSWTRLSACKTVEEAEVHLICTPDASGRGADCNLGIDGQVCSATLPGPMLPVAVGMLVDTGETPTNVTWRCSDAD